MAHYRKIDVRIWNDAKFNSLSHLGKLAFLLLITHPNMTMLGAMRATPEGLSAELKSTPEAFREAFAEALSKGLVKYDEQASCIWLPNFLRYQSAESPNVIKSWVSQVEFIPECNLKTLAIAGLRAYSEGLSEAFAKAFREAFGKGFPESVSSKQLGKPPSQEEVSRPTTSTTSVHGRDSLKNRASEIPQNDEEEF